LADSNGNVQSPRELAQTLVALRKELLDTNMSSEEINAILQSYAGRPTVELVKPIEVWTDEDLEEEAARRELSWLSYETDEDLVAELEQRQLLTSKTDISEDEFEREAIKRGFRSSLAQYSIEDIQSYLRLQGHHSSNRGSGGGGGGRRKNNNNKRKNNRRHSSHNGH
jgi:hypothetical protein